MAYFKLREFDRAIWVKLGVGRLFDWQPTGKVSLWQGYARNAIISFINSQVSKAAFAGQLQFEGFKVLDWEGKRKPSHLEGPMEKIPASYFRKSRSIVPY